MRSTSLSRIQPLSLHPDSHQGMLDIQRWKSSGNQLSRLNMYYICCCSIFHEVNSIQALQISKQYFVVFCVQQRMLFTKMTRRHRVPQIIPIAMTGGSSYIIPTSTRIRWHKKHQTGFISRLSLNYINYIILYLYLSIIVSFIHRFSW